MFLVNSHPIPCSRSGCVVSASSTCSDIIHSYLNNTEEVEEALVSTKEFVRLRGVTKTLSPVLTPVAPVQFVLRLELAVIAAAGLYVHVPKRSWVIGEPNAPTTMPADAVVVPVTPKATYGEVEAIPTLAVAEPIITDVAVVVPRLRAPAPAVSKVYPAGDSDLATRSQCT